MSSVTIFPFLSVRHPINIRSLSHSSFIVPVFIPAFTSIFTGTSITLLFLYSSYSGFIFFSDISPLYTFVYSDTFFSELYFFSVFSISRTKSAFFSFSVVSVVGFSGVFGSVVTGLSVVNIAYPFIPFILLLSVTKLKPFSLKSILYL